VRTGVDRRRKDGLTNNRLNYAQFCQCAAFAAQPSALLCVESLGDADGVLIVGETGFLAARSNQCLRFIGDGGYVRTDPATLADTLDAKAWSSHAAGEVSKGLRFYVWARIGLPPPTIKDGSKRSIRLGVALC
jgi:hypothetical protein